VSKTVPNFPTVACAHGLVECAIAVSMLEAAGISVLALPKAMASVTWHWMGALGGIEIRVPVHQAEMAMDILIHLDAAPKPRRRSIFSTVAVAIVFLWGALHGVPPPASGFYVVSGVRARLP
jgi:hypothetical protein